MDKKGVLSCDPGWNDPPLFSYDSQVAQIKATKPRTILNKRVAFPLHEASPPSSTSSTSGVLHIDPTTPLKTCTRSFLPPPPSSNLYQLSKEVPMVVLPQVKSDEAFDSTQALLAVMKNLNSVLDEKYKNEDKVKCEIQRRLDSMRKMWIDNKLSAPVQHKLLSLSEALSANDLDGADNIQKGLMVDHGPVCSPWMSGVRHLLHHQDHDDPPHVDDD